MTTEEKFNAALKVIRNLPKNGSYQPSTDLQLRFYGYYKQATEGPCTAPRPGFWEVVKKVKWEAWNRLGNMSREEAMNNYVEELKKIVETMSYNDNVADFLGSLGSFYDNVPMEDLELLIGNVIERVRSQPGSPLSGSPIISRDTSPVRGAFSSLETSPASSYSASPIPPSQVGDEEEEEEFIDSVEAEAEPERPRKDSVGKKNTHHNHTNGVAAMPSDRESHKTQTAVNGCSEKDDSKERGRQQHTSALRSTVRNSDQQLSVNISEKIHETVLNLQKDLDRITARVRSLEVTAITGTSAAVPVQRLQASRWPLSELSISTAAFVISWPLIVHMLVKWLERRRHQP